MFKNLKLRNRLLLAFWLIGLLPMLLAGAFTYWIATQALTHAEFEALTTARANKQTAVEVFIQGRQASARVLADVISLFPGNPPDGFLQRFANQRGFANLFLIDRTGRVIETATSTVLRGVDLTSAAYANTSLGRLFRQVRDGAEGVFIDFAPFAAADNVPAAFLGEPVPQPDGTGGSSPCSSRRPPSMPSWRSAKAWGPPARPTWWGRTSVCAPIPSWTQASGA